MNNVLGDLYDELYLNKYHHEFGYTHSKNLINNGIVKYLKRGDKVIDIGCSNGSAMKILIDNGFVASGMVLLKNMVMIIYIF